MLSPVIDRREVLEKARSAETLRDVGRVAANTLVKYYSLGAGLVMWPIKNGGIIVEGKPSIKKNLEALERWIHTLEIKNEEEIAVFNQLIFKPVIDKHLHIWKEREKSHAVGYYDAILYDFYGPILDTGLVRVLFLGPRSENSRSCKFVQQRLLSPAEGKPKGKVVPIQ